MGGVKKRGKSIEASLKGTMSSDNKKISTNDKQVSQAPVSDNSTSVHKPWYKKADLFATFRQSFVVRANFLYAMLADLAFYLIFVLSTVLYFRILLPRIGMVSQSAMLLAQLQSGSIPTDAQVQLAQIKSAHLMAIGSTIGYMMVLLLAFTFFKGLIWSLIAHKKRSLKEYWVLLVYNVGLLLFVVIVTAINFALNKTELFPLIFVAGILPIALYLLYVMHALFSQSEKSLEALKGIFLIGFGKIHYLILPVIVIVLFAGIFLNIMLALGFLVPLKIRLFILVVSGVAAMTWAKQYFLLAINKAIQSRQ